MRSASFALLALAASAMAAETFVTWRHEISTGSTSLTIQSADKTVLAETCGSSIGHLDFSRVDENGAGHLSLGNRTFSIQSQPQDGPVCTRIYNGDIAVVECSGIDLDNIPEGVSKSADCFTHEHVKAAFLSLKSRNVDIENATAHEQPEMPAFHSRILGTRQTTCITNQDVDVMGDGNPHQNYLHKQISEVISCGAAPSCSVGETKSTSFSIGFSTEVIPSFGAVFKDKWTKAGFSVQKTWLTGNTYSCTGAKGDDVCIWYNTAHTAYTVRGSSTSNCYSRNNGKVIQWIIKSPNERNAGGGYYCVIGTCRTKGEEYWDNSGRAGGP